MALCEVALSDGSDLVAKEMEFGQGWNSPSHTKSSEFQSSNHMTFFGLVIQWLPKYQSGIQIMA